MKLIINEIHLFSILKKNVIKTNSKIPTKIGALLNKSCFFYAP